MAGQSGSHIISILLTRGLNRYTEHIVSRFRNPFKKMQHNKNIVLVVAKVVVTDAP